jgi:hypothetical protein
VRLPAVERAHELVEVIDSDKDALPDQVPGRQHGERRVVGGEGN